MSDVPVPIVLSPLFKPKPWGGRMLESLFGKPLPPNEKIGESWEVADLPGNEATVRDGPHAGRTLADLVSTWGRGLYGDTPLVDGRFPLLLKFLDARENLSVQVHPKPAADDPERWRPGIKHEAWYVVHAAPGAQAFIGLQGGVDRSAMQNAAQSPEMAKLLRGRPARRGDCFYLPSGTVHALGAGLVVAEVQTPSDVTYRLYDWDRLGDDGRPRELHIAQALENTRFDVRDDEITQPRAAAQTLIGSGQLVVACPRFRIVRAERDAGAGGTLDDGPLTLWMVLRGQGTAVRNVASCRFAAGDVLVLPTDRWGTHWEFSGAAEVLEVMLPA